MKKIVKGNDFTLRIPVMKMVEGRPQAFPLPACTDVVVQVCNQFKRIPLAFEIDVKEDNVLLARVDGDKMSLGTYAIEVKGKIFGNDWRSNEYPQFAIVSNNAEVLMRSIENFAYECFNVTASHKQAVSLLTTIKEVEAYDYKTGYPKMLEMSV